MVWQEKLGLCRVSLITSILQLNQRSSSQQLQRHGSAHSSQTKDKLDLHQRNQNQRTCDKTKLLREVSVGIYYSVLRLILWPLTDGLYQCANVEF